MSFFTLLPEELYALGGLRHGAQLIYLKVVVPNRHHQSGIAKGRLSGAMYQLTYPGMQSALTEDARPGFKGCQYDKSAARRFLDELVRAGLVERLGQGLGDGLLCKIFVENRDVHFSAQNKPDTKSTPKDSTKAARKSQTKTEACGNQPAEVDTPKTGKADTFTEYRDTTTTGAGEVFGMHNDWVPDESFVDAAFNSMLLVRKGERDHDLMREALVNVRLYWQSSRGSQRRENQHGWHYELIRTMQVLKSRPEKIMRKPKLRLVEGGGADIPPVPHQQDAMRFWALEYLPEKRTDDGVDLRQPYGNESWDTYHGRLVKQRADVLAQRSFEAKQAAYEA